MTIEEKSDDCSWSREQDKAFENAIVTHPEDLDDRWGRITADVPGKCLDEVKKHYELLVEDVGQIESGHVPVPCYSSSEGSMGLAAEDDKCEEGSKVGMLVVNPTTVARHHGQIRNVVKG